VSELAQERLEFEDELLLATFGLVMFGRRVDELALSPAFSIGTSSTSGVSTPSSFERDDGAPSLTGWNLPTARWQGATHARSATPDNPEHWPKQRRSRR
jgi:hypothetical protein